MDNVSAWAVAPAPLAVVQLAADVTTLADAAEKLELVETSGVLRTIAIALANQHTVAIEEMFCGCITVLARYDRRMQDIVSSKGGLT